MAQHNAITLKTYSEMPGNCIYSFCDVIRVVLRDLIWSGPVATRLQPGWYATGCHPEVGKYQGKWCKATPEHKKLIRGIELYLLALWCYADSFCVICFWTRLCTRLCTNRVALLANRTPKNHRKMTVDNFHKIKQFTIDPLKPQTTPRSVVCNPESLFLGSAQVGGEARAPPPTSDGLWGPALIVQPHLSRGW